ncbi:ATP-binding protein [Sphingomonas sp. LB2R24]|uniref:ATP-binding protein n=1 Tax=Sphingomonas sorbitolis TaxID=3096165 RepID=UPI002FC7B398
MVQIKRAPLKLRIKPKPSEPEEQIIDDATDPLARQRRFLAREDKKSKKLGLVFADAFIRGMREIGYKNPAWALAELIDNSFQAGADTVDIRMKDVDWKMERSPPSQVAIIDNGIGMLSKMISHSVRWGGTDRENDRQGFGRYGYGLPSAAVSLAKSYSVYSKTEGKKWYVVHVDLEALGNAAGDDDRVDELLAPQLAELPLWLNSADGKLDVTEFGSGTIVVLETLDRLKTMGGWISGKSLKVKLLQHFGVIYRNTLQDKKIFIAGDATEIIDPLFLLPDARYGDETDVRSKQIKTAAFETVGAFGKGVVRIRAAVLPPNFQLADPNEYGKKGAKTGRRWDIMKTYNGILVCRAGRQIDVVSPEWTKFQNYDANIKIEIDFDPALDEFFGLTTSKQQIVIDEKMWEKLKVSGRDSGGIQALVKDMRGEFKRMKSVLDACKPTSEYKDRSRPSASAMQAAQKFKARASLSPQKRAQAEKALHEYAWAMANARKISIELAEASAKKETNARLFDLEFAAVEEAPFFQAKRLGLQKRLTINTAHPFYEKVYQRSGEAQAGLEVLLFVLADAELDAENEREAFYRTERKNWSEGLSHALEELLNDDAMSDRAAADAESG